MMRLNLAEAPQILTAQYCKTSLLCQSPKRESSTFCLSVRGVMFDPGKTEDILVIS